MAINSNQQKFKTVREKCLGEFTYLKYKSIQRNPGPYLPSMLSLKSEIALRGLALVTAIQELEHVTILYLPQLTKILEEVLIVKQNAENYEKLLAESAALGKKFNAAEFEKKQKEQIDIYLRDVEILNNHFFQLKRDLARDGYSKAWKALTVACMAFATVVSLAIAAGGLILAIATLSLDILPLGYYFLGLVVLLGGTLLTFVTADETKVNYRFFANKQFKAIDHFIELIHAVGQGFKTPPVNSRKRKPAEFFPSHPDVEELPSAPAANAAKP